jgi:hypothetical protein
MAHPAYNELALNPAAAKSGDLLNAFRWTATKEGARFWCSAWEGEISQSQWQPKLDAILADGSA